MNIVGIKKVSSTRETTYDFFAKVRVSTDSIISCMTENDCMKTITIYSVQWMTSVPYDVDDQCCRFDLAEWDGKSFNNIESARVFAMSVAHSNKWRQSWMYVDHAPRANSPEWQWERDHDATEIFEG